MAHIEQVAEGLHLHWLLPIEADDVIYSNCLLYCGYQATIMTQLEKSHKSLLACDPVYPNSSSTAICSTNWLASVSQKGNHPLAFGEWSSEAQPELRKRGKRKRALSEIISQFMISLCYLFLYRAPVFDYSRTITLPMPLLFHFVISCLFFV